MRHKPVVGMGGILFFKIGGRVSLCWPREPPDGARQEAAAWAKAARRGWVRSAPPHSSTAPNGSPPSVKL